LPRGVLELAFRTESEPQRIARHWGGEAARRETQARKGRVGRPGEVVLLCCCTEVRRRHRGLLGRTALPTQRSCFPTLRICGVRRP
jgi:hypothetical protein